MLTKNFFYWVADYLYVARHQIASILTNKDPTQYQRTGAQSILLIPGVYENWRFMKPIADMLFIKGFDVHVINTLRFNRGTIESMAELIATYIHENNLRQVIIVAHSKGGLIGKYLMSLDSAGRQVRGMIAVNTPFTGSKYARMLPIKGLRIFIPNSKILTSLATFTGLNTQIYSLYGTFDPHIPDGCKLEGAHNIQVKSANGHFRVLNNPDMHAVILKSITELKT